MSVSESPQTFDAEISKAIAPETAKITLAKAVCLQNNRGTIASLQKAARQSEKKRKAAEALEAAQEDEPEPEATIAPVSKRNGRLIKRVKK